MGASERFDRYMDHLSQGLGHLDRHAGLKGYCTGLMLPLARKSVEPMAARVDPLHASARHQALHHFVAKAEWSDVEILRRVCQWLVPKMDFARGGWWIIDDTGFPKKGKHSVGVARQYCGMLGKQDNCQVAVSVSLACDQGSVPVAWQLYLPEDWAADQARRLQAGVPEAVRFATKTQIALAQLRGLLAEDAPLIELVGATYQRWRIERDYQDLKQEFGLGHYEGRGWRGFHHHATLSIAAYAFLMAERLTADKPLGSKKNFIERQVPAVPQDYIPRGSPARAATRRPLNDDAATQLALRTHRAPRAVPLLRQSKRKATFVTQ